MKKLLITVSLCSLTAIATLGNAKDLRQQNDISNVVKELTYLIQVTHQLKHKYRRDRSKITFNYDALISQLKAARDGSKEYLNHELYELHDAPPVPKLRSHTRVAK